MGRLLLPCRVSKGTTISGVPASDTELCYRAEFFLVFLIIQSEFNWNKRVTYFLCRIWQTVNQKSLISPYKASSSGWRWSRITQLPPPTRFVGFFFQCKKEKNNNRVLQSRHEISIWVHQGYCQIPATSLTETNPSTPQLFFLMCKKKNSRNKKEKILLCFPTDPLVPPWGPPRGFCFEIHDSITSPRGCLTLVPLFKEGKRERERRIINNSVCLNSSALLARLLGFSGSCDCSGTATSRDFFCFLSTAATEK